MGALAYGRKITGRLAFQVAAGPQEIQFTGAGGVGNFHTLFASVNSALSYERRRSGLSFSYARGLTGGSGVFLGARAIHFPARRTISSRASGREPQRRICIEQQSAPAGVPTTQFNNWFIGANLGRQVGPHAQVNFNYGATKQNNPATCPVASCGGTGLQQTLECR